VLVLLQHSANLDLQVSNGLTALIAAADGGKEACVKALLHARANTELIGDDGITALQHAEVKGHMATAVLIRQHAAPPQPAAATAPAAPSNAGEPALSSPIPLPVEIHRSAQRGELQKVIKWVRKGGLVDALCSTTANDGRATAETMLHAAAGWDQLEMVRELLKQGASIDLPSSLGLTALMQAANGGYPSILLVLLQHSAKVDLQATNGGTALMWAANEGHKACVKALLRAKANTELFDVNGHTALQRAEAKGHTATAELIRQHAAPPQPAAASPAAPPGEPAVSSPAPAAPRYLRVGPARSAAEGRQVAAQGRTGRRALFYSHRLRPALFLHPPARRRSQQPPEDREGAAGARREHRLAKQPRRHHAHVLCGPRPPLHPAPPPAALGQP